MGQRGPAPRPSRLNDLAGNPGKRAANKSEPRPKSGAPGMPDWLGKEAKAEWRRIVPELGAIGMLSVVDRGALAAYCQAFADLVEARKILEAEGSIITADVFNRNGDKTGTVKRLHPANKLADAAYGRVKQFLAEFGLTPSSRSRLHIDPAPKTAEDGKARFFKIRG